MSKPFKTIDEQYKILQRRNISFSNEDEAKRYLLHNNYYNVINCYGKFFEESDSNRYLPGTKFDEITQVHCFDKEVKNVLFKFIIEAENQFKSILAYYFSESHPEKYSYLIATNFKEGDVLKVTTLISSLSKIIQKYKKEESDNSIKHYIRRYRNVPLWVLCNYITFGQTVQLYKYMKKSEQNKIAKELSYFLNQNLNCTGIKLQAHELTTFLDNILEVRNIVAHNNKLLGFKCRGNTAYISQLHSKYNLQAGAPSQDVFNVFLALQCLLTRNQYAQLHNTILKRTKLLNKKIETVPCSVILNSLGFPENWYEIDKLPQE